MQLRDLDDAELLRRVAAESRDAFAELYRRHSPWLHARLRHRCSDPAVVADALQDTFVAVWRSAERYDPSRASPAVFRPASPSPDCAKRWRGEIRVSMR